MEHLSHLNQAIPGYPDILHLGNLCLVYLQDRLRWIQLYCIPDHAFAMNHVVHCNIRLVVMIAICYMNVGRFVIFIDIRNSNSCFAATLGTVEITSFRRFYFPYTYFLNYMSIFRRSEKRRSGQCRSTIYKYIYCMSRK